MVAALTPGACTMSMALPVGVPPGEWSPETNTHPEGETFQRLLDRYATEGLPGVVLLVSSPEGQWLGASGYAEIETREPMLPTHLHHGASITKMYLAAAVLIAVEDGSVELDSPVRAYLPEAVWRPIPNGGTATVRQLLGHTSGIPDFSGDLRYDLDTFNDPLASFPTERMVSYLQGQSAIFPPGEGYFYSNANYLLLALILDQVSGASHADLISDRILRPLGLLATYYKNEPGYPAPSGLVNSYQDLAGDGHLVNGTDLAIHGSDSAVGYAGVMANASDFAHFLEALLEGRVVDRELLEEMQERPVAHGYGLGLSFLDTPFGVAMGHSGGSFGVQSQVRRFPDRSTTVVLLSNGGDGGAPARLFNRLWDEVLTTTFAGGPETR